MNGLVAAIGRIVVFDPGKRSGVIERQDIESQRNLPADLYFKVGDDEVTRFRVGQLVRFVVVPAASGAEAKDVAVLSETA